ncbi:MAG TPA: EAL domain-containing protein [Burkholderiales bacterium]|nr:EAL domain-containing protein [Burkholderiales bacterium]
MHDQEAIRSGLSNQEFFLEYLPTVSLKDGRCVGCEALIRWRHNGRVIPPLEFIPIIENTALSGPITYWVIDNVAQQLGSWLREHRDVHISVNIPPGILGHTGLSAAIANSNLIDTIDQLIVEITERGMPDKVDVIPSNRGTKRRARVALDDAIMTETSLVTLSQSRVDIVKIDKPFIDRILRDDCPTGQIATLEKLLRGKKHVTIAEGVETAAQAEHLKRLGVDMAQGWYFSSPLSAQDFKKYFDAHR